MEVSSRKCFRQAFLYINTVRDRIISVKDDYNMTELRFQRLR